MTQPIDDSLLNLHSALPGVVWPAVPPARGALLLALLHQFNSSEWWPESTLKEHQFKQLAHLLRHAYATVPFYRERFYAIGFNPGARLDPAEFHAIPMLTRRNVQAAGRSLHTGALPTEFGEAFDTQTSGSTGEPVRLRATAVDRLLWQVFTLRDHQWHARDLRGKLASIRVFAHGGGTPPHGTLMDNWGPPASEVCATGPLAMLKLDTDISVQARWLAAQNPDYLLTYPSNLAALISKIGVRRKQLPRLREVRTVGEIVTPELRALCQSEWGVPLVDVYSSQELGYIALQCPVSGLYHVMAESVLVEILNANGRACAPGEVGRLVITKLHNFATPLIRYEINDYAEAGPACPCGRGLPTLARIVGRTRNMLTLPSGEQRWPLVGFDRYREIAPVRQYQFVQRSLHAVEARLIVERPLTAEEERRLAAVITAALGHPFEVDFVYVDTLARGAGGKFEEFISAL